MTRFAYVGCYTTPDRDGEGQGISVYRIADSSHSWELVQVLETPNPSFLTLPADGRTLYAVHGGNDYSQVSAFIRDARLGTLEFLNSVPSGGANPVHLDIDATGRWLVVANYTGSTVAMLGIAADGRLQGPHQVLALEGEPGPHPVEQTSSHPHHCPFDPAGRTVMVPDKGLDRTWVYRLDTATGLLEPAEPASVAAAAGAGPRHAAFHPSGRWCYIVNEQDSTLTACSYDAASGALLPQQTISTLPPGTSVPNTGSEVDVSPNGRFLYASNRGHDSIVTCAIDQRDGTLTPVAWTSTQGSTPRFFGLDPSGDMLYVANQASHTIVPLRVDTVEGTLRPAGEAIATGSPACIVFADAPTT
jgi:6-phosphogluconolactonase